MSPFTLRPAVPSDAAFIYDVSELTMRAYVDAAGRRWATEKMRQKCEQDARDPACSIVVVDGKQAGVYVAPLRDGTLWIDMLFLMPLVQRRGIGRALVRLAIRQAATIGGPLCIKVMNTNPARVFWQKLGFVATEDDGLFTTMRFAGPGALL